MGVTRVTQYKPNFFTFIIILLNNMRISPDYELIDVHQFSTYKRWAIWSPTIWSTSNATMAIEEKCEISESENKTLSFIDLYRYTW